jgi:hypothetical protein
VMQVESNRGPVSDPLILAFRIFDCFVTWFPGRPSEEPKVMRLALTVRVERRGKRSSCSRRSRWDPTPGLFRPLRSSPSHRNSPPVLLVLSAYIPTPTSVCFISQLPAPRSRSHSSDQTLLPSSSLSQTQLHPTPIHPQLRNLDLCPCLLVPSPCPCPRLGWPCLGPSRGSFPSAWEHRR